MAVDLGPRTRWGCLSSGGGYSYQWERFPRCLRQYRGVGIVLHTLTWHLIGPRTHDVALYLHRLGFLYAEAEGDVYTWQWRFWRGSPHARALRNIG
jgi:hypothetical protein